MLGHDASGRKALDVTYPQGAPGRGIHRAALFQLLWDRRAGAGRHSDRITGGRCPGAPGGPARVAGDLCGQAFDFPGPDDLIVRMPAAPARVRCRLLALGIALGLGYGAIWGTVPWPETDLSMTELSQRYRGASRMAGILPIGRAPDDPTPLAAVFWSMPPAGDVGLPTPACRLARRGHRAFGPNGTV